MNWPLLTALIVAVYCSGAIAFVHVVVHYERRLKAWRKYLDSWKRTKAIRERQIAETAIVAAFREAFRACGRTSPITSADQLLAQSILASILED